MTIEQTINRSAKTPGGIIGFSKKASTYHRWAITRHTRGSYAQAALNRVDMTFEGDNIHKSVRSSELKRSEITVQKLMDTFKLFMDPFDVTGGDQKQLYCLSSGQPASDKVSKDLLSYVDSGKEAADEFINARIANKTSLFHDTLKRKCLATFATMSVTKSLTSTQKKTIEIKADRNLLGRLLCLSQKHDISLTKLFAHPLGPIP